MLEHGGRLREAAARYGIPLRSWHDLSTGISPQAFPIPSIPRIVWQRLPEENDGLELAASAYYQNKNVLPVAGSQAAIMAIPRLFIGMKAGIGHELNIACLGPLYAEHPHAWLNAGHHVTTYTHANLEAAAQTQDVVVVCNPNNPTAEMIPSPHLLSAARRLRERGGYLIVDEAFADAMPENSLSHYAGTATAPNLIVLRSLGKFFGLAGARVGFVLAHPDVLTPLREHLGPWGISGPARWVAQLALDNTEWQEQNRQRLHNDSARLAALLQGLGEVRRNPLFCYLVLHRADDLAKFLARRGILVRFFAEPLALRFGLPNSESAWEALTQALEIWKKQC